MPNRMTMGRCRHCNLGFRWPASSKTLHRLMSCPECGGGLDLTTKYLKSIPVVDLTDAEAKAVAITEVAYREAQLDRQVSRLQSCMDNPLPGRYIHWNCDAYVEYAPYYYTDGDRITILGDTDSVVQQVRTIVAYARSYNKALPKTKQVELPPRSW